MYVHQQAWDDAQRVAELHCPESVADVLIGQVHMYRFGLIVYIDVTLSPLHRQGQHLNRRTIRKQRPIS